MPLGVNFRKTAGYVTDPSGFVAQTDYTLYTPSRGYGYLATPTGSSGVRDRAAGLDPQLAGVHFSNAAFKFRIDLLNGPGRYRLRAVHHDEYDNPTGFRYWDGQEGQEIAYVEGTTYDDSYQTILGNHPEKAQFSQTKEDYVEHVFESDHIIVERDVYLTSGLGIISSVWVEPVTVGLGDEKLWLCPSLNDSPSDISGNGNDGTYQGGIATIADVDATHGGSRAYNMSTTSTSAIALPASFKPTIFSDSTVSAWFKYTGPIFNADPDMSVIGASSTSFRWYSAIRHNNNGAQTGTYRTYADDGANNGGSAVAGTGNEEDNAWHHVTFVRDYTSSTGTVYVDGISIGSASFTSNELIAAQDMFVGYGSLDGYAGNLAASGESLYFDDIRAYDRVLTQAEITHLASRRGITGSPFGKGLGGESLWICPTITNTQADISGHNFTATLNGGMSIVNDTNNGGSKCFEFDGSNDYISTDMQGEMDFVQRTGVWSMSAWVKFDDGSSSASFGVIATEVGAASGVYGFSLRMSSLAEGLRGDALKSNNYITYVNEGSAWPDASWHHIAFVSDGTTATLYRDGVSVATQALGSLDTALQQYTANPVLIGAYKYNGSLAGVMDGRMDDIRIFRRQITESEVTRLASSRGVLGPASPEGLGDEVAWLCPTITGSNADISQSQTKPPKYVGASVVSSTGSSGTGAFEFTGAERVTLDQKIGFQIGRPYSISLWVKKDPLPTSYAIIAAKMENSGDYTGWDLTYDGNKLLFGIIAAGSTSYRVQGGTPTGQLTTDWQHFVVTWDGSDTTGLNIYIDGAKQPITADYDNFGSGHARTGEPFTLGGRTIDSSASTYSLDGQIDDFRAFGRILDDAEISHLSAYRAVTGKPPSQEAVISDALTYVPMQEQGTTFYCQKTNIAGTLTDTNSTGRHVSGPTEFLSNAVKFDASRQRRIAFASVPPGLGGMTKYTVSAWVKGQVTSTANRCVVSFEGTASSRSYRLDTHVSASTAKGPSFYHGGSQVLAQNTLDNTDQWQHVAVTVDTATGTRQSWINGQLDIESAGSPYAAVYATLNYFAIGATTHGGVGTYHDAAIAGVGIWDKILSPVEINSLYSGYGRKLKGLRDEKLWIVPSRTGDRSNVMYPAHADTELNGSLSVIDDVDEGGTKAIQFNDLSSTSNYLGWDDNTDSDPVTVAFWIKQYIPYYWTALIGKSGSGSLRVILDPLGYGGSRLRFSSDSNGSSDSSWFNQFGTVSWHHIAMVRDYGTSTKFYVNGSLVSTGSANDTTAGDWDAAEYFIGVDKSSGQIYNNLYADIDDLRVIDGAATSDEIAHLSQYRGILGGPYIECEAGEFDVTGNNAGLLVPVRMTASAATFTLTGQVAHGNWIPEGLGTELMWVCPTYTGDRSNLAPSQNATTNGGSLSVINDTTSQGLRAFDCTVTNNASNYWRFNYGSSRPGTLSFWMKKSSTGNWWQTMARRVTSGNAVQVQIRSSTSSNTNFDTFNFWNDNATSNTTTTLNGTWHHVVLERDRGGLNRFFVDGVAYGSYTGSSGSMSDEFAGTMQFIASSSSSHSSGQYNFTGLIDDIRLFDTQLTSAEIAHLASRRGSQGQPVAGNTSMAAVAATFAVTGQSAALGEGTAASVATFVVSHQSHLEDIELNTAVGAFSLAGQAVSFVQETKLPASVGTFALSGVNADLAVELNGSVQPYLVSSQDTDLDIELNTTAGSLTLTAATQVLDVELNTAVGAFSLSGTAAELSVSQAMPASAGSFVLAGVPADDLAIELNVDVESFAFSGAAVEFSVSQAMPASAGSFVVTGAATDDLAIELNASVGTVAIAGVSANLQTSNAKQLSADATSFAVTPQNTAVLAVEINQTAGSLAVSGVNAPLDIATVASAASFSVASQSAFLGLTFQLTVGTFQVTGTSLPPLPGTQRPNPYYYRFLMQDE